MLSLDLFGLVFAKEELSAVSEILRGEVAVTYIKNELLAVEPNLSNTVGPGRLTRAAVWGLLARLHLNAAVYRDRYATSFDFKPEDMDQVVTYTERSFHPEVHLSIDYFAIFGKQITRTRNSSLQLTSDLTLAGSTS